MRKSLTFNGVRKSWLYLLEGRSKPPFAPVKRNLLTVPGKAGAYLQSTETDVLVISQPVGFIVKNDEHALQLKDELATWLITDKEVELQFDDEPGRTYYAVIQNTLDDFSKFVDQRRGTIQFLCVDPYAYGEEQSHDFTSDTFTVENKGTAEAKPIIELEVLEPVTFAMIQNQKEKYNMIGKPVKVEEIPAEKYPRLLRENGSSLSGWSYLPGGQSISDGVFSGLVGGSMASTGYAFYADSFGENPNGWVGPAIRQSFSESKQDFKYVADLSSHNAGGGVGKIVVALWDENDNIVASMGIVDSTNQYANNTVHFRLGGNRTIHSEQGARYKVYNDSRVYLELIRQGQLFKVRAYEILDNGIATSNTFGTYLDKQNEYQAPIRQVVIYIAKAKHYGTFDMYMNNLSAFGINDLSEQEIPYIAEFGDIITFDHENKGLFINGIPSNNLKVFGGSFFNLDKDENQLLVQPSGAFKTKVKYRPPFL